MPDMARDRATRRKWFGLLFLAGGLLVATNIAIAIALGTGHLKLDLHTVALVDRLMPPGIVLVVVGMIGFVVNLDQPSV